MPGASRKFSANILLKNLDSEPEQCIPYHCLLEQLGGADQEVVHVTLRDDTTCQTITRVSPSAASAVPLGHSPACNCRGRSSQSTAAPEERRPLRVGVVVLVETTEPENTAKILLTRRKDSAALFPGEWVLPGGHVDEGEDLVTAAIREVQEETGIRITGAGEDVFGDSRDDDQTPSVDLICMWESNYPQCPTAGPPTSHHLVPFYRVKVPQPAEKIPLQLQEEEVSGAAWVDSSVVKAWIQGHAGVKVPCPFSADGRWPPEEPNAPGSPSDGHFEGIKLLGEAGEMRAEPFQFMMSEEAIALGHQFCLLNWALDA